MFVALARQNSWSPPTADDRARKETGALAARSPQPKFCDASAASKNCAITWNRNIQEALGVEVVFLTIFTA